NKPLPQELANCAPYLEREIDGLKKLKVIVALGKIGFDAYLNFLKRRGLVKSRAEYVFSHGAKYKMPDGKILLGSYHPSNQNTQTGKLTRPMLFAIFKEAAFLADKEFVGGAGAGSPAIPLCGVACRSGFGNRSTGLLYKSDFGDRHFQLKLMVGVGILHAADNHWLAKDDRHSAGDPHLPQKGPSISVQRLIRICEITDVHA